VCPWQLQARNTNQQHTAPCTCTPPHHRQDRAFNTHFLKEEFDIGPEQIDALFQYARFQFDCGNYSSASELLQVRVRGRAAGTGRGTRAQQQACWGAGAAAANAVGA
jgi:hypothetical protein